MKHKIAIYSANVGNYDEVLQPKVISADYDYILFTNDTKETNIGVWQVRPFNYTNSIQTKIARYLKANPEEMLPEYEYSVWMDSNLCINDNNFYHKIATLIEKEVLIATMDHPLRHCTYREAAAWLDGHECEDIIIRWDDYLRKEQYPENNGLFETNVLFRHHHNKRVAQFDKLWWWCIENYSRRDQLSFNYVAWKIGVNIDYIYTKGVWASICPDIIYSNHANTQHKLVAEASADTRIQFGKKALDTKLQRLADDKAIMAAYIQYYIDLYPIAVTNNIEWFISEAETFFMSMNIELDQYKLCCYKIGDYDNLYNIYKKQIEALKRLRNLPIMRMRRFILKPIKWIRHNISNA